MPRTLALETINHIGQSVTLNGWVNAKRDHGGLTFIDLRDRTGIVQLVGQQPKLRSLKPEYVIQITGTVASRSQETINPEIPTGKIEVKVETITVLNQAATLPLPIDTDGLEIDEDIRLKYRYLDLRRQRMQANLRLRSQLTTFIRNWLTDQDFVEIDTPILTKTTPEGARDFIVPSRLQPGKFYALPQSPQQYKQMLMVAGLERYFQFARCFRDEDARSDRAYGEFTQLDLEMSFVVQEDILSLTEELFTAVVSTLLPHKHISQTPWPRLSHQEAITQYGTDKPDLRRDKNDPNELAFSWTLDFPLFNQQTSDDFFHGSGQAQFAPSHHMFTAPHPDDIELLNSDPLKVRGLQHDLVLNGYEVGGGSIRIHDAKIQSKVFDLIGFTPEQKHQFEHMLTAFTYGVPPHGGIAPGLDRFLMAALGEPSVREVMAFPTATSGRTAVVDAPSLASTKQLTEVGIKTLSHDSTGTIYEQILDLLKLHGINYRHYIHQPVTTSEEAQVVRPETSLKMGAKALILRDHKDNHFLFVVPGDKKADLKALRHYLKVQKIEFAKQDWVDEHIGIPFGAIPPFGSVMKLKTYVDADLEQEEIIFNAGKNECSIRLSYQDFITLEKPEIVSFN